MTHWRVQVPSAKNFARGASTMWPFWLFYVVLVVAWLLSGAYCQPGHSADAPPAPTCSAIRQYVQQFGEALVLAQARAGGLTDEQIRRLKRECAPVTETKK